MADEVKKQHYVPQFYLRHFSESKGLISVYDKETDTYRCNVSINSQAQERFFYDLDPDKLLSELSIEERRVWCEREGFNYDEIKTNKQYIEKIYNAAFENKAAIIINELIEKVKKYKSNSWCLQNCVALGPDEKEVLAQYFSYQYIRGTYFRKMAQDMIEGAVLKVADILSAQNEELKKNTEALEKIRPGLSKEIVCNVDSRVVKLMHLQMLLDESVLQKLFGCLMERKWSIFINFGSTPFITSDHPVQSFKIPQCASSIYFENSLLAPDRGMCIPISPTIVILLLWEKYPALFPCRSKAKECGFEIADEHFVAEVNKFQVVYSLRYVYSDSSYMPVIQNLCRKYPEAKNNSPLVSFG